MLPLIFRYADTGRNPYVRHHATEALNFNLTFLIAWLVVWPVTVVVLVLLHRGKGGGLSSMFGGSLYSSLSGSSVVERNLDRLTIVAGVVWAICIVGLSLLYKNS